MKTIFQHKHDAKSHTAKFRVKWTKADMLSLNPEEVQVQKCTEKLNLTHKAEMNISNLEVMDVTLDQSSYSNNWTLNFCAQTDQQKLFLILLFVILDPLSEKLMSRGLEDNESSYWFNVHQHWDLDPSPQNFWNINQILQYFMFFIYLKI